MNDYAATYIATPAQQHPQDTQAPAPYSGLGAPAPTPLAALTPQQQGWLALAEAKNNLFTQLQAGELAVQAQVKELPLCTPEKPEALTANLKVLQDRIATAKKIASEHKEMRLSFTTAITDKVIKPAMEFEQRSATLIATAGARELEMRKAASEIAQKDADTKREENALVVHISNEQIRIANDYRQALLLRVHQFYIACLNDKTATPDFKDLEGALREIKPGVMAKFQRRLVSYERATELLQGMKAYDPNADLQAVLTEAIPNKFAMYAEDLKNAEAAAKKAEAEATQQVEEAKEETTLAMATNTLMGQAETAAVDAPKVKRKLEWVEGNTQAAAFAVIAAFVKNSAQCAPKLRVKTWGALKVSQMAKALAELAGETGEQFQGMQFKEIEK